jgi:hypothetical protein
VQSNAVNVQIDVPTATNKGRDTLNDNRNAQRRSHFRQLHLCLQIWRLAKFTERSAILTTLTNYERYPFLLLLLLLLLLLVGWD